MRLLERVPTYTLQHPTLLRLGGLALGALPPVPMWMRTAAVVATSELSCAREWLNEIRRDGL